MKEPDERASIHAAAREAIDEDDLAQVLELTAGEEYEQDAVAALREVTADELVADVLAATAHARRRGGPLTGADVGDAADRRRLRCCQPEPLTQPTSLKVEW